MTVNTTSAVPLVDSNQLHPAHSNKLALALGLSVGAIVFLLFVATVLGRFCWKLRRVLQLKAEWSRNRVDEEAPGAKNSARFIADLGLPTRYSYLELSFATSGFSPKELIGYGGFGHVFRGHVPPGDTVVAVKRLSEDSKQGEQEFIAEVSTIGKLRHRNLVQLKGWCYERGKMLLVYEYMPNGSLDKLLYCNNSRSVVLEWSKRYKILEGVAAGLAYLHDGWEKSVVHRDVKPSNVLLDRLYDPRLADFGLAKLIDRSQAMEKTMPVAGTLGYVAPELHYSGKGSAKSDVYSFGILLLVVACGRSPVDQRLLPDQEVMLLNVVWKTQEQGDVMEAADARLGGAYNPEQMRRVLHLGLLCCYSDPDARPTMRFCEEVLRGEAALPPVATTKPPLFFPITFSLRFGDSAPKEDTPNAHGQSGVTPTPREHSSSTPRVPSSTTHIRNVLKHSHSLGEEPFASV